MANSKYEPGSPRAQNDMDYPILGAWEWKKLDFQAGLSLGSGKSWVQAELWLDIGFLGLIHSAVE